MSGGVSRSLARARWFACALVAAAACSPDPIERCRDDLARVKNECDFEFDADEACGDAYGRCWAGCYGAASCSALDRLFDAEATTTEGLLKCLDACEPTFSCEDDGRKLDELWVCDGENDCVDGSDERKCDYFQCANGAVVNDVYRCDDHQDCGDGSDEEDCW